ncbi:MAG: aminoglycoside phosphotransferase family protein [Geminicoccaceae bacterium]
MTTGLDRDTACDLLVAAGFSVDRGTAVLEQRDDRRALTLPGDLMAWFPMTPESAARLAVERRILDLLAARCSFRAPRVVHNHESGWQVRALVPGRYDPFVLYERIGADPALARRLGRSLGGILAEQHACATPAELAGWLPDRLPWPEPTARLWETLPQVVDDPALLASMDLVLRRYEAATPEADDVLLHGDLGLHNLVLTPDGQDIAGIFDYGGAACADRHQDFRYFVLSIDTEEALLEAALDVYETSLGRRLDRERIRLGNAACSIGFLAYRAGTPPDVKSCGRTLAEDLDWLRWSLGRLRLLQ